MRQVYRDDILFGGPKFAVGDEVWVRRVPYMDEASTVESVRWDCDLGQWVYGARPYDAWDPEWFSECDLEVRE